MLFLLMLANQSEPAFGRSIKPGSRVDPSANTSRVPGQILRTGINLSSHGLSSNSRQLADIIELSPLLEKLESLRAELSKAQPRTLDAIAIKQELLEGRQDAMLLLGKTSLEIDFTLAEIEAELQVYDEILSSYKDERDRTTARTEATGLISNGILWAVAEALTIPGFANARFSIPSGIIGIPAGVVPSIASLWTLRQMRGKRRTSERAPNMLSRIFGYPITEDVDYPETVWKFFNSAPPDAPGKTRFDVLIERWIADANMPAFSDRSSRAQLDVLTASVARKNGMCIDTLTARQVMLRQLAAEIMKMKRMLLELTMVVRGDKELRVGEP
ncbi:MAG: hypothetical protein AB7W16_24125 [Candidatus Obscuribacterales bacterium]